MKHLIFFFFLFAASSCNMCKVAQRHLHKHPDCIPSTSDTVYIDSIIPGSNTQGEIQYITDSSAVDSLKKLLKDCELHDSVFSQIVNTTKKTISFLPVNDSNSLYHLKIWPGKKGAMYSLEVFPQKAQIKIIRQKQIVPAPKGTNWWKVAFLIWFGVLTLIGLGIIYKHIA